MNQALRPIASCIASDIETSFYVFRPNTLARALECFQTQFQATCLYAVKTNPEAHILTQMMDAGMRHYDVASLEEIATVRERCADAELYFMHPVKPRHSIRKAYRDYGVRHFSLDSVDELEKIWQETEGAKDLHLHVRLAMPNTYAELNLAEKFGVTLQEAPELLKATAAKAQRVGVCFHTGSQSMHPDAYRIAIRMAGATVRSSGIDIAYFNVGGGFPSIYPGMTPPAISEFFDAIHQEFARLDRSDQMQLLAEPGRALVAECMSLIVRVELRKGTMLYINDGTYGSLFDAGTPRFIYPVRRIESGSKPSSHDLAPFSFYGPTCDSLDYMKGPFYLPSDIAEGEFIEIGQMGAYGRTMATRFNGFHPSDEMIYVDDAPLMSMYDHSSIQQQPMEIIAA